MSVDKKALNAAKHVLLNCPTLCCYDEGALAEAIEAYEAAKSPEQPWRSPEVMAAAREYGAAVAHQPVQYLCNRSACRAEGATNWNTSTRAYYCDKCAKAINEGAGSHIIGVPLCVPLTSMPLPTVQSAPYHKEHATKRESGAGLNNEQRAALWKKLFAHAVTVPLIISSTRRSGENGLRNIEEVVCSFLNAIEKHYTISLKSNRIEVGTSDVK